MCHTMARLLMRHKDALSVLQQSTTWILFLTTQPPGIILPKLFNTAQGWHEMKYNDPESITQPMRIILWQKLMAELCLRAQKVLDDPEARDQAIQLHLYDPNAGFGYRKWSNKEGGSDEAPGGSGATPSKAHCGDSAGAGDTQRALPAPEQVSCHQATPGEDGRHDSDLALGNWLERGADCTVLGTPPASLTQLGSHDDWLHSPSRQAAEISSGTAAAIPPPIHEHAAAATAVEALAALALIPRLQLQNSSNYCYSHACLLTYLWTVLHSSSSYQVLDREPLRSLFRQARRSPRLHLWSLLPWRQAMRLWKQPSRQHDAADFLLHLHQILNAPCLQGLWQSYDTAHRLCDEGGVCPLVLSGLNDSDNELLTSAQSHSQALACTAPQTCTRARY